MKAAIIIALVVLAASPAIGATTKDKWQRCLDNGVDMMGCSQVELERLDPIFKSSYQSALARTTDRDRLAAVQKAWENFSKLECNYAFSTGGNGTLSGVSSSSCLVEQTRRRIYELSARGTQGLVSQNSAPHSCSGGGKSTDVLVQCVSAEVARNDKILNRAYRKILAAAAEDDKALGEHNTGERPGLVGAERAWIAFRDAQCGYLAAQPGGSNSRLKDLRCRAVMTVWRTRELASDQ